MKTKILGRVRGIDGKNFCVGATVDNVNSLPSPSSVEVGTHCYVGVEAPREVYFCDGNQWINQGYLYSRDTSDIGKMVKEYINFNLSELETMDSSDMLMLTDDKSDIPDMIVGSVGYPTSSGNNSVCAFNIVEDKNDYAGNVLRTFCTEDRGATASKTFAILTVATGTWVNELLGDLYLSFGEVFSAIELPKRVIILVLDREASTTLPMNYINLSGIYCYGGDESV